MGERYIYNTKTRCLHIEGYCQHAYASKERKLFLTEDEALAYGGRALGVCSLCTQKREKMMKEK